MVSIAGSYYYRSHCRDGNHKTTHASLLTGKEREKQTLCTLHPMGELCFDDAE